MLPLRVDEIVDMDGANPRVVIPPRRVKKRRVIVQPLSDLAVRIVREALTERGQQYVFKTPQANKPLHRHAPATALRGRPDKGIPGICEVLGLALFTPHDLRRTTATLAASCGFSDSAIARCLDHQSGNAENVSAVTAIYVRANRLNEKREVLDGVAVELRRIIGPRLRLTA